MRLGRICSESSGSSLDAKQPYKQVIMHEIGVAHAAACSFSRDCTGKIMFSACSRYTECGTIVLTTSWTIKAQKTRPTYMQHRRRVEFQTRIDQIKSRIADPGGRI